MAGSRRSSMPNPPALPPVSSKAKDYSMDRPSEVQNELDELRNRGLAKVLNRHFTGTTKRLAKEKAAADAALADLERRRANTKEFVPSKGGELSPFDAMYVQLQQKRAECRRKERETMLLYQRYVTKFGNKTKIDVPVPAFSPTAAQDLSPSSTSIAASVPEAPPPPSPAPTSVTGALQPLDENSESVVSADVNFSKHINKKIDQKRAKDPPTKVEETQPSEEEPPSSNSGVQEANRPEESTSNPVTSSDPPEHGDVLVDKDIPMNENVVSKRLEQQQQADPPAVKFADESRSKTPDTVEEDLESEPVHAAVEPVEKPAEEAKMADTKSTPVETKTSAERLDASSDASDSNRPALEVTTELPATKEDDVDDDDDRSIISGLTMNSHMTRQVLDEIEQEMDQFLKTETEAIRKILDEEERTLASGQQSGSVLGEESKRASVKAEAMALEMQRVLDEYAKDDRTLAEEQETQKGSDPPKKVDETESPYPKPYETDDPSENWMIYYDDSLRREYYFEKNTKRTQWELPGSNQSNSPVARQLSDSFSTQASFKTRRSRTEIYRRRLRKRRIRRLVVFVVLLAFVAAFVLNWQQYHPEKSFVAAAVATVNLAAIQASLESIKAQGISAYHSLTSKLNKPSADEPPSMDSLTTEEKQQKEREATAEREEQARLAREAEEKAAAAREVALRRAEEERRRQEKEAEDEAERRRKEEENALRRPWACNLPLAYVHPRCNRLATLNPIYEETDLINSFMQ